MQSRAPLMIEHRLIERMLSVIRDDLPKIKSKHKVDPVFVDIAVDFIRVYADRTHHGKEEDILFVPAFHSELEIADGNFSALSRQSHLESHHTKGRLPAEGVQWAEESAP